MVDGAAGGVWGWLRPSRGGVEGGARLGALPRAPRPPAPAPGPPSRRAPSWHQPSSLHSVRRRLPPALQIRSFALLWTAMLTNGLASQMLAVAIGWQVYAIHRNPLDLGLVGLMEFLPLPILALPAGQIADRLPPGPESAGAPGLHMQ